MVRILGEDGNPALQHARGCHSRCHEAALNDGRGLQAVQIRRVVGTTADDLALSLAVVSATIVVDHNLVSPLKSEAHPAALA